MFTRTHRIGRYLYSEALESYRDPKTGTSRHRCIARWRADVGSFAEALGRTRFEIAQASESVAYYQAIIDGTVRPRFPRQKTHAAEWLAHARRDLQTRMAHLAALTEARNKGLAADDGDIEQATQGQVRRCQALSSRAAVIRDIAAGGATATSPPPSDLSSLADQLRQLTTQNDPDVVRARLVQIAVVLDAAASPAAASKGHYDGS